MPTHQDETLQQRYEREHQDYLKLCGSMTAEQVADLQLQLNNALAREQDLQQRLTAADEQLDDCGQFEQRQIAVIQEFSQQVELLKSLLKRCQTHLPGYALALRTDVDSALKVDEAELLK